MSETAVTNRHGRKPGRGLRPALLIPKIVAVAMLLGGLAAVAILLRPGQAWTLPGLAATTDDVSHLFRFLVIPAAALAGLLGIALLLQHPRILLRQRWLQMKLVLLVIAMPLGHLMTRTQMQALQAIAHGEAEVAGSMAIRPVVVDRLLGLAVAAQVLLIFVMILGRHKPTLGQNWARAYRKAKPAP